MDGEHLKLTLLNRSFLRMIKFVSAIPVLYTCIYSVHVLHLSAGYSIYTEVQTKLDNILDKTKVLTYEI